MTCTQSCVGSFPRKSSLRSPSRSRQSTPGTASRSASVRLIRLPKRTRPECYDFRRDLDEAHAPRETAHQRNGRPGNHGCPYRAARYRARCPGFHRPQPVSRSRDFFSRPTDLRRHFVDFTQYPRLDGRHKQPVYTYDFAIVTYTTLGLPDVRSANLADEIIARLGGLLVRCAESRG